MARSIGDCVLDRFGIIAEPEVTIRSISLPCAAEPAEESARSRPFCIILASDGVWEFVSSAKVCAGERAGAPSAQGLAMWAVPEVWAGG